MTYLTQDSASESNDDADLAIQAKKGDIAAFESLYRLYYNRICVYLVHLVGDDGIACELTQETFFKAWRSLPSLRETTKFGGWLYRIATHLAYDHKRHVKNEKLEFYHNL